MATVIDNLVVKLGLDTTDFVAGEKKVASGLEDTKKSTEKVGSDIAANGKKASEFFGQLEKAALKFFAVLTVGRGLSDFTRTVIGTGADLDRVSKRVNISADTLSRWQGAVRQSGGSAEGFLGTIQGISQAMTELQLTGNTEMLPFLQRLGVSVVDAKGKAKPIVDLIRDIGDAANAKIANPGDRFNILQRMGFDEGTINLIMKGAQERDKLLSSQKAYSQADADAALKAQEKWEGVKLEIERTSQAIVIGALPVLDRLSKAMLRFAEDAVPALLKIGDVIGDLDKKTNGWSTALLGVLATLRLIGGAGVLGGITRLGGSLGGVIAAALLLKGDASEGEKKAQGLSTQAVGGDREAAVKLARTQLGNQWWRTLFGGKVTEEDVQARADSIMKGEQGGSAAAPGASTQPGISRAQRNNNPGNLEFRGQNGAVPEDGSGRFAKFGSAAEGVSALVKQLQRYGARGLDSLDKIIAKYAPPGENDTQAYIDVLSKKLGVAPSEKLDLTNPDTLKTLVKGISKHEAGVDFLSNKDVMTGINMAAPASNSGGGNTSIGEIKVYTQAQDANGIARDIKGAMIRQADTAIR